MEDIIRWRPDCLCCSETEEEKKTLERQLRDLVKKIDEAQTFQNNHGFTVRPKRNSNVNTNRKRSNNTDK